MKTQYNDDKTKAVYLISLAKTKKLKIKIANLQCKYLEESIVVMNLISERKEEEAKYGRAMSHNHCEGLCEKKIDLHNLANKIHKLKVELEENNNLLMRTCIVSEDIIKHCLNDDWEVIKEGYEEFRILTNAIKDIEGIS